MKEKMLWVAVIVLLIGGVVLGYSLYKQNAQISKLINSADQTPIVVTSAPSATVPENTKPVEPLSYSTTGVPVSVSKKTALFDFTAEQLKAAADECGSQHSSGYFNQLVSKFSGTTKTIYNFKYTGASQESNTFTVTLLPNKAGYTSLDQFKKDFDICAAGGDAYPTMLNSNWLLFKNSCGSGVDDGSGRPIGCQKVQDVVESSLKLN